MRVGYARVSTNEQPIENQIERLACDKVFAEKQSGSLASRPQLQAALEFVREGDTLVVTRLDRLARSISHLCDIAETLRKKGVELQILDQAIDTSTATGKLLFHMLGAIAEFELSIRKDQQRAGMALARSKGKHAGRPFALSTKDKAEIRQLLEEGRQLSWVANRYRVHPDTIKRALRQA
jgi:DNA invertase Pin-like site-specific DNA recombinase